MSGRFEEELLTSLPDRVILDEQLLTSYSRDMSFSTAAGLPRATVRAASQTDVATAMRLARAHLVPVVPRGAGTGLSGGANAVNGCVVIDLSDMDRILDIDTTNRLVRVEPGVVNRTLQNELKGHGLFYPPDPGSMDSCTIGGNIATNAGGMCCAKYGVTTDHVAGLTAVLMDGSVIRTGAATRKNVAGFDLTHLLVGSEGTLAVVTEALLRVRPLPRHTATFVAVFGSVASAMDATLAVLAEVEPSLLELMDSETVSAVEAMAHMGLGLPGATLLVGQCDGPDAVEAVRRCADLSRRAGAVETHHTGDEDEGRALVEARRLALPALERLGTLLLDDVAVPLSRIAEFVDRVERVAASLGVRIATFGHAADGNLHPTVIFDARDPQDRARADAAFGQILDTATSLGGSITGEHGVGLLKRPFLASAVGEREMQLMWGIKRVFDPENLLNPGKAV